MFLRWARLRRTEIQLGRRLFTDKGCASCHVVEGAAPQKDFGPDLSALGGKDVSQLSFGDSKIPRNLIAYIQAKITDPVVRECGGAHATVPPVARRPRCCDDGSAEHDRHRLRRSALQKLTVPRTHAEFRPAGEFARIYERYKCYVCHRVQRLRRNARPGSFLRGKPGAAAWLISFLKNPQTLRPTLIFRMPQFNMTDQEATVLADYIGLVLQSPAADPSQVDAKTFTPENVALGKQLYEVKYQCQSCHTIGSTGGYVGPNLNNAGNWLTPAWIEAWLRNPQALVPGTIEPHRTVHRRRDSRLDRISADAAAIGKAAGGQAASGPHV